MFTLKKLVSQFIYPLQLSFSLLAVGLLLLAFTRRKKLGMCFAVLGTVLLYVGSYSPLSDGLVRSLEAPYPPLLVSSVRSVADGNPPAVLSGEGKLIGTEQIGWVVVLAGYHNLDPRLPPTSQLGTDTLTRVVEGVRLMAHFPNANLLFSGGQMGGDVLTGEVMSRAASTLGVPAERLKVGPEVLDTREEAVELGKMVGPNDFVLVTSATHMPRSIRLFRKVGLKPIPSSSSFFTREGAPETRFDPADLFPQVGQLEASTRAVHEYVGMIWSRLRGQI